VGDVLKTVKKIWIRRSLGTPARWRRRPTTVPENASSSEKKQYGGGCFVFQKEELQRRERVTYIRERENEFKQ
jgi:hypothetical protein